MPRPSSKVMTDPKGPDLSAEDADPKPLKLVIGNKGAPRGPKVLPPLSKAETKAQVLAFKEALKKAREPLVLREGALRMATNALAAHDKDVQTAEAIYSKAQTAAEKVYAKHVVAQNKARKTLLKAQETAQFSVNKAAEQYAKGEAKINAQIEALVKKD